MESTADVRVLEESQIFPIMASPAPPPSLQLTFFDILLSTAGSFKRLFFYDFPHPAAHFVDSVLPKLKSSLSLTLGRFYPLAGNLRCSSSVEDVSEISCTNADSISFVLAESDGELHELCSDHARDVSMLRRLVPWPIWSEAAKPLMAVQVVVFPNRGFTVGISAHHVACDGATVSHFMSSWASACRFGKLLEPSPLFDRTKIPKALQLHSLKIISSRTHESSAIRSNLVSASFTLEHDHIWRLKSLVMAKAAQRAQAFHCSTVVVTYAYLWTCLVKTLGYAGDRVAHLLFTADCRARLQPPMAATYFGNCIVPCFVQVKVSDLVGRDGVFAAAEAIGKVIEGLKHGVLKGAHEMYEKWMSVTQKHPVIYGGSAKFRYYDIDFGWGRPVKVEPIIPRTRIVAVHQSRRGDGVEIGLAFEGPEMDMFEKYFSDGLKLLLE